MAPPCWRALRGAATVSRRGIRQQLRRTDRPAAGAATRRVIFHSQESPEELAFDRALRPRTFAEFIGQRAVCDNLEIAIQAARTRGEPLDHVLLAGPPGLGKTSLSYLIAAGMGTEITVTAGPILNSPKDLMGPLSRLGRGDVFFIDEIHRMPRTVEEYLYAAMEDQSVDVVVDPGVSGRSVRLTVEPFTLVGATTREGLLTAAFRSRFGLIERLRPYPDEDIRAILLRAAGLLGVPMPHDAADYLARHSRGVPRHALRIQRRVRDLAQVRGAVAMDLTVVRETLERLQIDGLGLEEMDRKILTALITRGEAIGLKTLAAMVDEAEDTLEDVFEPHLIRCGLLTRTPRGRLATAKAYDHLGIVPGQRPGQNELPFGG
ncbi:MAG: Holliday junction branch migration DNA helicase RuvB [Planctomycetes bacterium]|nr:Holliday junction branch migration DNA helicase RuvB [Planctomycetota bacterium]